MFYFRVMCDEAYLCSTRCQTAKLTAEILVKKSSGLENEGVTGLGISFRAELLRQLLMNLKQNIIRCFINLFPKDIILLKLHISLK